MRFHLLVESLFFTTHPSLLSARPHPIRPAPTQSAFACRQNVIQTADCKIYIAYDILIKVKYQIFTLYIRNNLYFCIVNDIIN